ncbi:MAG TPA: hypothetical protein VHR66_11605 [Gemmataceae bacterium]|nr:hypothetical protein [Gemmataceae bacterium]
MTIDKYSFITVKRLAPLFDYTLRISYSRTELVNSIDHIEHPAVRECLRFLNLNQGLEIHYVGDLPARTGLGSSSSFTVGLLNALHVFRGDHVSKLRLAEEAVHVEQKMIRERVGVQDQYTCAQGGLVQLEFGTDGRVSARPVPLRAERAAEFQAHLMLFYTGIQRSAHEVIEEQLEQTRVGALTESLNCLSEMASEGIEILVGPHPVTRFGVLLHRAWMLKRGFSRRTTSAVIDGYYQKALAAGAAGGKLLGAGGGGFLLLLADPTAQPNIRAALADLTQVPFSFERTGTSVLFYHPE